MLENSTAVSVAALLPLFHDLELSGLFRKFCDRPAVSLFNHMPYEGQGNDPFLKGGGGEVIHDVPNLFSPRLGQLT